ncbi:MAG: A24 family peptidase [Acidilobaceae archaeon]|nr:A24 family peptidase [Acidilobaceae archaeon]
MEVHSVALAYVTLVMLYAGISDIRTREVDPRLWLAASIPGAPLALLTALSDSLTYILSMLLSLLVVAVAYVLYRFCIMGGADVLAMLFVAVMSPVGTIFPSLYLAVIYSAAPSVLAQVYYNYRFCRSLSLGCIFATSHEVEVKRLLEDPALRWWGVSGESCREEDPREILMRVSGGDLAAKVRVSPGHPYIAYLAIGLLLVLLIGDMPIRLVLKALGYSHFVSLP